jgi:hypothetical protein
MPKKKVIKEKKGRRKEKIGKDFCGDCLNVLEKTFSESGVLVKVYCPACKKLKFEKGLDK